MSHRPIRVLVVDDSAFVRAVLTRMITSDPDFTVVGATGRGSEAAGLVTRLQPDVVTLDVEMPDMNGLDALVEIMRTRPTPVVMVSSLTASGTRTAVQALALGAVDVVGKPSGPRSPDLHRVQEELLAKLRAAAAARPRLTPAAAPPPDRQAPPAAAQPLARPAGLAVVGSSTGGPGALHSLLGSMPPGWPGAVVVVQHMPPTFTASLAEHLNAATPLTVREARDGDRLEPATVLVAPGGHHLVLAPDGTVRLDDSPPRHGLRPAVDVTLESVPEHWAARCAVIILTGMGVDGLAGARRLHRLGARVAVQDEESSVVFGMPRAVWEAGLAELAAPPQDLARWLVRAGAAWPVPGGKAGDGP